MALYSPADEGCEKFENGVSGRDDGADKSSTSCSWSKSTGCNNDRLGTWFGDCGDDEGNENDEFAAGVGGETSTSTSCAVGTDIDDGAGGDCNVECDVGVDKCNEDSCGVGCWGAMGMGDVPLVGAVDVTGDVDDSELESKRMWAGAGDIVFAGKPGPNEVELELPDAKGESGFTGLLCLRVPA